MYKAKHPRDILVYPLARYVPLSDAWNFLEVLLYNGVRGGGLEIARHAIKIKYTPSALSVWVGEHREKLYVRRVLFIIRRVNFAPKRSPPPYLEIRDEAKQLNSLIS